MKTYWATVSAAFALTALLCVAGGVTLYQDTVDRHRTEDLANAVRMDELYSEARLVVNDAEFYTQLATRTGDPSYLVKQEAAGDALLALIDEMAVTGSAEDRAFGSWAQAYITPFATIFAQLREDPPVPYDIVMSQYADAYIAMYESLRSGLPGAPAEFLNQLVDPAIAGWEPNALNNPIATVLGAKASQEKMRQASALVDVQSAQRSNRLVRPLRLMAGSALLLLLIGAVTVSGRKSTRARAEADVMRRIATTDPLTGLGNRRRFEESGMRLSHVPANAPVTLLLMDLDEFKNVNDTFGHARGDSLLTSFAALLTEIAPPGSGIFRIGGDEFAMILPLQDPAAGFHFAERLRKRAAAVLTNGVSVSIGLAVMDSSNPDEMLLRQQADAALYEAKMKGRNVVVAYQDDGWSAPVFPAAKLQAVRNLLAEGRIDAVFQPIWDIDPRTLLGYEGLSRPHADYGLSGASQAFEIAERLGHAAELDSLCRQRILVAAAELLGDAKLFINLSPHTLTHHSFSPFMLLSELRGAGIPASRVVYEITEKSQVPHEVIAEAVAQLRCHGLSVALDDVGSGNNGLELMRRVTFDYYKVDSRITAGAIEGGTGRAALMAILAFAAESNAIVIAEGVEDAGTLAAIRGFSGAMLYNHGPLIHSVQGFLLGMPLPAAAAGTDAPAAGLDSAEVA